MQKVKQCERLRLHCCSFNPTKLWQLKGCRWARVKTSTCSSSHQLMSKPQHKNHNANNHQTCQHHLPSSCCQRPRTATAASTTLAETAASFYQIWPKLYDYKMLQERQPANIIIYFCSLKISSVQSKLLQKRLENVTAEMAATECCDCRNGCKTNMLRLQKWLQNKPATVKNCKKNGCETKCCHCRNGCKTHAATAEMAAKQTSCDKKLQKKWLRDKMLRLQKWLQNTCCDCKTAKKMAARQNAATAEMAAKHMLRLQKWLQNKQAAIKNCKEKAAKEIMLWLQKWLQNKHAATAEMAAKETAAT